MSVNSVFSDLFGGSRGIWRLRLWHLSCLHPFLVEFLCCFFYILIKSPSTSVFCSFWDSPIIHNVLISSNSMIARQQQEVDSASTAAFPLTHGLVHSFIVCPTFHCLLSRLRIVYNYIQRRGVYHWFSARVSWLWNPWAVKAKTKGFTACVCRWVIWTVGCLSVSAVGAEESGRKMSTSSSRLSNLLTQLLFFPPLQETIRLDSLEREPLLSNDHQTEKHVWNILSNCV